MTDTTADTQAPARPESAIDKVANAYFDAVIELSPIEATFLGAPGEHDTYDDLSPAGLERRHQLDVDTLAKLDGLEPADDVDKVTLHAMRERLGLEIQRYDAGLVHQNMNNIASPIQVIRQVYDLMPTETSADWAVIARRVQAVPTALDGYFASLQYAADEKGRRAARRQVQACIDECAQFIADDGFFAGLLARADAADAATTDALKKGVEVASAAYAKAAERLRTDFLDQAPEADAVGREVYALESQVFLGSKIDLEATYHWGQQELARITEMMQQTAEQIKPGASVQEAIAALDEDPAYRLDGTDALQKWMQGKADEVIREFNGTHFDIPEQITTIECMIAPTTSGGIYYTGPSEDFTRPGRMWWSVPKGVTEFGTWRELTTVYHEGVPGHHLQVGQTTVRSELLNKWRRMLCWVSGHGEGWALYSEWLMSDLGYMDDPGNRMGLLDAQSMRAARVVLDIGFHCGFEAPAEVGGGEWTYDKAWKFLTSHVNMDDGFLKFELDRYLGWPGQAPSYKIGERLWLELRDESKRREGDDFDLKAFHRRALDIGSVGLDTLRAAVLDEL